jgi:hypothetical protein
MPNGCVCADALDTFAPVAGRKGSSRYDGSTSYADRGTSGAASAGAGSVHGTWSTGTNRASPVTAVRVSRRVFVTRIGEPPAVLCADEQL